MEINEFSEVPPPKIQHTGIPCESMQTIFQSHDLPEEMQKEEIGEDEDNQEDIDYSWDFDSQDPWFTSIMNVNTHGEILPDSDALPFVKQFSPQPETDHRSLLTILIRLFRVSSAQNYQIKLEVQNLNEKVSTVLQQNSVLKDKLENITKQNRFLTEQNIKFSNEVGLLKKEITSLKDVSAQTHPQPVTSSYARTYLATAATSLPYPPNGTQSSPSPTSLYTTSIPRQLNYPLQIHTTQPFQSCEELRIFLRPVSFDQNLPMIKNISRVKKDGELSNYYFKLIFTKETDRSQWQDVIKAMPQYFLDQHTSFGFYPKITFHGFPANAETDDATILQKISTSLNCKNTNLKMLFKFKTQDQTKYVFSIHPEVRRHLWKQNDRIKITDENIILEVTDFVQPLQCANCGCFGHATKNCSINISCKQCNSSNCPNPSDQICQQRKCINCRGPHMSNDRRQCPRYKELIERTKIQLAELKMTTSVSTL
jgi:hypothetical protein